MTSVEISLNETIYTKSFQTQQERSNKFEDKKKRNNATLSIMQSS